MIATKEGIARVPLADSREPKAESQLPPGSPGPLAVSAGAPIAAISATGAPLRGEPAAVVVAPRWRVAFDATEWAIVTSLAGDGAGGAIVGGSFAGTLRAGARVVASAGQSDGFVARVDGKGELAWLVRLGGAGSDAVQGVAFARGTVAIGGVVAPGADLLGAPLPTVDDKLPFADGFVAVLDAATGARRWSATFGGRADDAVAGVAIDARGRVVVAATVRGNVHVGNRELGAHGAADGLVAWWSADGKAVAAVLLGGDDFDGLSAIGAAGERVVVGGFFRGAMKLGERALVASGDDAFVAALDASGHVVASWQLGGPGREDVVALAATASGFVAAVAHTAALAIDGAPVLPAPADPLAGAALVARTLR